MCINMSTHTSVFKGSHKYEKDTKMDNPLMHKRNGRDGGTMIEVIMTPQLWEARDKHRRFRVEETCGLGM